MQLASFLIGYLAKLNKTQIPAYENQRECFAIYRALLKDTDLSLLNGTYFSAEEKYLHKLVEQHKITDVSLYSYKLSVVDESAVTHSAQLLVNPINGTDRDVFVYGGSRFKLLCKNLAEIKIDGSFALGYERTLNIPMFKNISRLTSDIINEVKDIYGLACDYIVSEGIKTVVFLPLKTGNPLIDKQLLKLMTDTVGARQDLGSVKKIICTGDIND